MKQIFTPFPHEGESEILGRSHLTHSVDSDTSLVCPFHSFFLQNWSSVFLQQLLIEAIDNVDRTHLQSMLYLI